MLICRFWFKYETRPEVYSSDSVSGVTIRESSENIRESSETIRESSETIRDHLGIIWDHLGDTWCHLVVILVDSDRQSKFLSQ